MALFDTTRSPIAAYYNKLAEQFRREILDMVALPLCFSLPVK
jgi:hypothetical protein